MEWDLLFLFYKLQTNANLIRFSYNRQNPYITQLFPAVCNIIGSLSYILHCESFFLRVSVVWYNFTKITNIDTSDYYYNQLQCNHRFISPHLLVIQLLQRVCQPYIGKFAYYYEAL